MSGLIGAVSRWLEAHGIAPCRVVAAVSGGADSTALLLALHELRFDLVAGHVNHHLRGAESDDDEHFVRSLCERLGVPLRVADGTLDRPSVKERGIEGAAREVRTRALLAMREECGARWIAIAHQKNDQAETVLMRLFTGSGIGGLRGIHPVRDDGFIRPLLEVGRAEVEAFLRERAIVPRVDSSNADPRFLRNRIRATLREYDSGVIENVAAIADAARERWAVMEKELDAISATETEAETRFAEMPPAALLLRHVRRLDPGARGVSLDELAASGSPRVSVTRNLELGREGAGVVLRRRGGGVPPRAAAPPLGVARAEGRAPFTNADRTRQVVELPRGATPDFEVRRRKEGDRFQPLGMSEEKKLKDFLIDRKVPAGDRDALPIVTWNGEIVWVAGVEVSERFKVTGEGDCYELIQSPPSPTTVQQENLEPIYTADEIAERVRTLGREIRQANGDGEVFYLCILKGASFLLADLMRSTEGQVGYGFIDVIRDVADAEIATALEIDFLSYTDIAGRNVYLLKDVVSTGVIESYLLTQLRQHQPASLRLVALLDRPVLRTVELNVDHRAFEVGEGAWSYVGYGLEIGGRHASLPYIARFSR